MFESWIWVRLSLRKRAEPQRPEVRPKPRRPVATGSEARRAKDEDDEVPLEDGRPLLVPPPWRNWGASVLTAVTYRMWLSVYDGWTPLVQLSFVMCGCQYTMDGYLWFSCQLSCVAVKTRCMDTFGSAVTCPMWLRHGGCLWLC